MEKHMSKTIDTSRLGHATLKDHLTEGELNAVVGGSELGYAAVKGAYYGGITAAAPGTWIPPGAPTGILGLK